MESAEMKVKDFKVLLVYANTPMEPLMPLGIASLATALESHGFSAALFDTTFYNVNSGGNSQSARAYSMQVKPVDYAEVGVKSIDKDPAEDFVKLVHDFKPDLIGLSCVELTYPEGLRLLESVKDLGIPNIVGGCFATFSPEEILANSVVDMVCVGEGEEAIVELSRRMSSVLPLTGISNVWVKNGNRVIKCDKVDLVNIETLPIASFDIFAPERIYRAMGGRIYRMLPIEFSRGCPYSCTYCSAPSYTKRFSGSGRWLRFKTVAQIIGEVDFYAKKYKAEYFYFVSETFLAMPQSYRKEFYSRYRDYRIPFWFNTRPETINAEDIKCLEDIGCHRISIGIESGNEGFRRKMLKRNYSNEEVLKAIDTVLGSGIQVSVNNMIGFPDETREMVFDTIELNRKFKAHNHSVSIFQPFRGTELYDYCVSKGYWDPAGLCAESFATPALRMPSLSKEEVMGLYRTFNLYISADKTIWPDIRKAEKLDEKGNMKFSEITKCQR